VNRFLIISLGVLLLAALGYFCIYQHSPLIENDIHTRTQELFTENSLDKIDLDIQGRDITLQGIVDSEDIRMQAERLASNVYGARKVTNLLTITSLESTIENEPVTDPETEQELTPISSIKPDTKEDVQIESPKLEPLPKYTCQQDFDFLLANEKINFATNSATIDGSSDNLLTNLIDVANQCPKAKIEISGHTDSRGSEDYNQRLSQDRATSVMNYLIDNGIDAARLTAVGHGESYPIADNDTPEGLAINRRIEFNVEEFEE